MKTAKPPRWQTQVLGWIVEPVVEVAPQLRQRLRLLIGMTFILPILGVVLSIPYFASTDVAILQDIIYAYIAAVLCMTLFYVLARWGYYIPAAWGVIITINIAIYVFSITDSRPESAYLLVYLLIPIFLSGLFFNVMSVLILCTSNLLVMSALPLMLDSLSQTAILVGPTSAILLIGGVVFLWQYTRRTSEGTDDDHRSVPLSSRVELLARGSQSLVIHVREDEIVDINHAGVKAYGLPDVRRIIGQPLARFLTVSLENAPVVQYVSHAGKSGDLSMRTSGVLQHEETGSTLDVNVLMMDAGRADGTVQLLVYPLDELALSQNAAEELEASEQRYRTVSELMSDYAYGWKVKSISKRLLEIDWITGAFEAITGYQPDEARSWHGWVLIHPEDIPMRQASLQRILDGQSDVSELRIITKSGDVKWVCDYSRPIFDDTGTVTGIYGAVRDVTSWYEAESALRTHALQQAVVAELGQRALTHKHDVRSLFDEAVTLVAQTLDVPFCSVVMLDEATETLAHQAAVGWEHLIGQYPVKVTDTESLAVYTIRTQSPVVVVDTSIEDRFDTAWMRRQYHIVSAVSVPIAEHNHSFGTLGVYAQEAREYSADDINFLQAIANVIAAFLKQTATSKSEAAQRNFAEALSNVSAVLNSSLRLDSVMDRVLSYLSSVLPHDAASIMILEHETVYLIDYRANSNDFKLNPYFDDMRLNLKDLPVLVRMVETHQAMVIPDVRESSLWQFVADETNWIKSYVGAPIVFQEELLGILNVDSATPNLFTEQDAHRLQAFANQASIAIHNARRAAELEEHVRRRTQELNLEHRRLQTILDATGEGIFYAEELALRYANRALCQMTGYYAQELENQPMSLFFSDGESTILDDWETLREGVAKGEILRHEVKIRRKDGTVFDAALTISLADVRYEANSLLKTVTLVRDISREKLLDEQRSRFIANASHELRSPIASMNTRIYMMRRKPDNMTYHLDLLERVVDRMNVLVEDLLDTTRFERGTMQLRKRDVIIQPLVESVVEVMEADAARKDISVSYDVVDDPLRVFVDPDRIKQVLTNLIANAINYTDEGGAIAVQITIATDEPGKPEGCVHITVKDSGIGISPDDLEQVFNAFFRAETGTKGMGLGLNIAREIMLHHEGDITVESVLGEGSTFTIHIPLLPPLA